MKFGFKFKNSCLHQSKTLHDNHAISFPGHTVKIGSSRERSCYDVSVHIRNPVICLSLSSCEGDTPFRLTYEASFFYPKICIANSVCHNINENEMFTYNATLPDKQDTLISAFNSICSIDINFPCILAIVCFAE